MKAFERKILVDHRKKILRVLIVFDVIPRLEKAGTLHATAMQKLKANMKSETKEDKTNKLLDMLENSKKESAFDDFVNSLTGYSKYATIRDELLHAKRKHLRYPRREVSELPLIQQLVDEEPTKELRKKEDDHKHLEYQPKENRTECDKTSMTSFERIELPYLNKGLESLRQSENEEPKQELRKANDDHEIKDWIKLKKTEKRPKERKEELEAYVSEKDKVEQELRNLKHDFARTKRELEDKEAKLTAIGDKHKQEKRKLNEEIQTLKIQLEQKNKTISLKDAEIAENRKKYIQVFEEHQKQMKEHKTCMDQQKEHMDQQKEHMKQQKEHMKQQTDVLEQYRRYLEELRSPSPRPQQRSIRDKSLYIPHHVTANPPLKKTTQAKPPKKN